MDITRVNGLIDTFEGLTPEEKGEALKRLLSSIDRQKHITVEIDENETGRFTITGEASEMGREFLRIVAEETTLHSPSPSSLVPPDSPSEQFSNWGQELVSLVQALDFGDYSDMDDSVEYIRKQRAAQRARRLGRED
jgi:hypothetical protein